MNTWCIFGSRGVDRHEAFERLNAFADENNIPDMVFSGGAPGADTWGEEWARSEVSGIVVRRFDADWKTHGKAAGPIRNEQMASALLCVGGIGVALWDGKSRGTKDMMSRLQAKGVKGHVLLMREGHR